MHSCIILIIIIISLLSFERQIEGRSPTVNRVFPIHEEHSLALKRSRPWTFFSVSPHCKDLIFNSFLQATHATKMEETETENRYQNTMDVLQKSGLLDIALRTSELAKQNQSLQRDLDTLEHIVRATFDTVEDKWQFKNKSFATWD